MPGDDQNIQYQLQKVLARIYQLNRKMLRAKSLDRKADTRRKIQLGGLVIKAKLDAESTNILMGLLLEAKEKLEYADGEKIRQWRIKGDLAFIKEEIDI